MATQDPAFAKGLVVEDKAKRIFNYHEDTVRTFMELIGAAGIYNPAQLTRSHIYRRVFMNEVRTFEDIFPSYAEGCMLNGGVPERYRDDMEKALADKWN